MITCARCGHQVPPGYTMCPRCGAALEAPRPAAGYADASMPDWMGGVQGAAPLAPPAAPGSLSVGSLLSEDAVPEWMRTGGAAGAALPPSPDPWGARAPAAPGGWSPPPPPSAAFAPSQMPGFAPGNPGYAAPQSAAGLFNESALPDWLREASAGQPQAPAAPAYPPSPFVSGLAPSPAPGPATPYPAQAYGAPAPSSQYPGYGQPGGSLAANALFDAGALPTWLGGAGHASPGGRPARPEAPLTGDGLQVSSLVDERALPMWLRQEPEQPQAQTPQPGSVSRWLSAPVTEEPMPPFLNQVYDAAQVSRNPASAHPGGGWGAGAAPAPPPLPGAVRSANLVDDSALPLWLRAQADTGGQAYQPPAAYTGAGAAPGGWGQPGAPMPPQSPPVAGSSFAASDLIDPGAVPPWVQQGAPPPQPTFSSTMGWTDRSPAITPNPAYGGTGSHAGVPMNPGWDVSALNAPAETGGLPSWLQVPNGGVDPATSDAWGSARHGAWRGQGSAIPTSELPPWLQNGAPLPPEATRGAVTPPRSDPAEQQWDALQSGWGDDGEHYADRFGQEEPDTNRPFSMEYDRQVRSPGDSRPQTGTGSQEAPERGKGKRKRRGR